MSKATEAWERERNIIAGERAYWRDLARRLAAFAAAFDLWINTKPGEPHYGALTERFLAVKQARAAVSDDEFAKDRATADGAEEDGGE